ncbi:hypothetical protein OESDEN_14228 [Oesophagostomum dentatum]|uniref:Uncharacterized protein n=1 Tax=Oesophagostomum dentatum TaxID=61180 RepID=A0A0B1SM77_OESDE|nr:hypothetical protein OESDEN_14228 [Oesophagostomum dentatum]
MINAFIYWFEEHLFLLPRKYIDNKSVRFPIEESYRRNHKELLNLLRDNTTSIGCAEENCRKHGVNDYRAFCLTDEP